MIETTLDLRCNIAALTVAILRDDISTVEQAFSAIEGQETRYTDKDSLDMLKLKEQMSWNELAEVYGVTVDTVRGRVRKIKNDLSAATEKVN